MSSPPMPIHRVGRQRHDKWTEGVLVRGSREHRTAPLDAGMTLVEVVAAIGVAVVVLLAAAGALINVQKSGKFAESRDRAVQIANDRIEAVRALPWSQAAFPSPAPIPVTGTPGVGETPVESDEAINKSPLPASGTETITVGNTTFTVTTRITWTPNKPASCAGLPSGLCVDQINNNTGVTGADGVPDDAGKRIVVRVSSPVNGKISSYVAQTVRYGSLDETVPSVTGVSGAPTACELPTSSAFCSTYATTGMVLEANAGQYVNTIPVTLRAVTRNATSGVTVVIPGVRTFTLSNPSTDGRRWELTLPPGTPLTLGNRPMVFTTASGATASYASPYWWTPISANPSIAPAVDGAWAGEPGALRADTSKGTSTTPATGSENPTDAFCVDANGVLWNYQPLFFDVRNTDDQDGPATAKPTVTLTGVKDTYVAGRSMTRVVPAAYVGNPSGNVTGTLSSNAPGTGYVGTRATSAGAMNTTRWYAALPAGYAFAPGTQRTVATISIQRPGDGMVIQTSAVLPLKTAASAAACDVATPGAPQNLTVSATGGSVTATWSAVPYSTAYRVYMAIQSTPSDPLNYTLVATQPGTSYTPSAFSQPGPGKNVTFKVVAVNRYGTSPESTTASAATVPLAPSGVPATAYGNYFGLYENTTLASGPNWTTSMNLYRSTDGGAQTLVARGANSGGAAWSFIAPQSGLAPLPTPGRNHVYYAEACNAAGCSTRSAGPTNRVPYWYGVYADGSSTHLDMSNTAYGSAGAYTFANIYHSGADVTFLQPSAWRSSPDYSMLFAANGKIHQSGAYLPGPPGNAARTIELSYKESGGFSAGWLFARVGTGTYNGFSAYNKAAGVISMNLNPSTPVEFSGLKINDGSWHMYAFVYDGTNVSLYEDGVLKGTKALVVDTPASSDLTVNASSVFATNTGVTGWYDEFINYNEKALTATQIANRWASRADS